jgi:hypothetical protein
MCYDSGHSFGNLNESWKIKGTDTSALEVEWIVSRMQSIMHFGEPAALTLLFVRLANWALTGSFDELPACGSTLKSLFYAEFGLEDPQ